MPAKKILSFSLLLWSLVLGCASEGELAEPVGVTTESVVGGWQGNEAEFYSTVEIRSRRPSYGFCTGTLIARRLVLTAGHCVTATDDNGVVELSDAQGLQVGAGYLASSRHRDGEVVGVDRVIVHERFDGQFLKSSRGADSAGIGKPHDLALLVLSTPITVIDPIRILSDEMRNDAMKDDSVGLVSGYGVFDIEKNLAGRLYVAEALIERVATTEILTDGDLGDTCFGDSGGPLYVAHQGRLYVAGVVSRGRADVSVDCGAGGIYTFATAYGPWIYRQAEDSLAPDEFEASGLTEYVKWAEQAEQQEVAGVAPAVGPGACSAHPVAAQRNWGWLLLLVVAFMRVKTRSRCSEH